MGDSANTCFLREEPELAPADSHALGLGSLWSAENEGVRWVSWLSGPLLALGTCTTSSAMRRTEIRPWLVLGGLALVGVGLLAFAAAVDLGEALHELAVALGGALVIGGVLGGTVDLWLKHLLLRDAFQATFGYLLPAELRDELAWIYEQELLCFRHEQLVTIEQTDDPQVVVAKMRVRRDVRNVSRRRVLWTQGFSVDDWLLPGHSPRVTSLRFLKLGSDEQPLTEFDEDRPQPMVVRATPRTQVELAPGEELTATAEAEEPKRVNDALVFTLSQATRNPSVTVEAIARVEYAVYFGNREQEALRQIGPNTVELPGTLLPGQVLTVRWWQQQDARHQAT
jgi:hypothetical protein